jgi:hypothetical protein
MIRARKSMHRRVVVLAAALLIGMTMSVSAGQGHRRMRHQGARIQQGIRSGRLTVREAARLRAQQRAIQGARAYARADGRVTRWERRSIRRSQRRASRNIWRKKHNRWNHR